MLDCGHEPTIIGDGIFGAGYGVDANGKTWCYQCCADLNRLQMLETGDIWLYLTGETQPEVINWPGTLRFKTAITWRGKHNWGLEITFFRFIGPDGAVWSGRLIGNNSEMVHCRRTKIDPAKIKRLP